VSVDSAREGRTLCQARGLSLHPTGPRHSLRTSSKGWAWLELALIVGGADKRVATNERRLSYTPFPQTHPEPSWCGGMRSGR
jgi:hypothetical protein